MIIYAIFEVMNDSSIHDGEHCSFHMTKELAEAALARRAFKDNLKVIEVKVEESLKELV